MSFKHTFFCASTAAILLSACSGGGSSSSSSPSSDPITDTTAPAITLPVDLLEVPAGGSLDFTLVATDSGGFGTTEVSCAQGSLATIVDTSGTTQTVSAGFGAPATAGAVECSVTSTDSTGNSSESNFTITVSPPPVETSAFNGTWFGPCFNTGTGFSVRQALTINETSFDSAIERFTAGNELALDCVLPADGIVETADVSGLLTFGEDVDLENCVNDRAVETEIEPQSILFSDTTSVIVEQEVLDGLAALTGSADLLPSPTNICELTNGNLSFAGVEYTQEANTEIINPTIDLDADVVWSLGENNFSAGTSSSTESIPVNTGVTVVNSTVDVSNGEFSGSEVTIRYRLNGSGVYQVTDSVEFALSNSDAQVVDITAFVGTAIGDNRTLYGTPRSSGFIIVQVDESGVYHFSTESAVTLDQQINLNGGVEGAPETFEFEVTNLFDFQ